MKRIGLFKLASCSGCLVEFLYALTRKPELLREIEIISPLLTDDLPLGGFEAVFIEGSIATSEHEEFVKELRRRSKWLFLIGTCALHGGMQNLGVDDNKPVSRVVDVDYFLPGCPVDGDKLYDLLRRIIYGGLEVRVHEPLCMECKRRGVECVLLSKGIPCLGPLTRSGCGAICPSSGRGCIGCYGFREDIGDRELEIYGSVIGDHVLKRYMVFLKAHGR